MIQPSDIKDQKFKKGLFGYKAADIDSFINTVYRAYDDLYRENAELSSNLDKVNESLKNSRLRIFELENQVNEIENVPSYGSEDGAAKKKADDIIKNAEAAAAEIIAKAKEQAKKFESGAETVKEEVKEEEKTTFKIKADPRKPTSTKPFTTEESKESASSKFFKKGDEKPAAPVVEEDDDEIFVGEIEDARKPERMMIGDGEEEEDLDFEFL